MLKGWLRRRLARLKLQKRALLQCGATAEAVACCQEAIDDIDWLIHPIAIP